MDDLREVITHLNNHLHAHKQEMIALRQLAQNFFVREPEYAEDVIQLDTANQSAKFTLRMSFPARYVNVINNTGANVYIATGEPALQPATAILVQANRAASFIINKTQVITVFQSGTATDGQNTVNFQFSDHPLPMTANTVSIQQINVQTVGGNSSSSAEQSATTTEGTVTMDVKQSFTFTNDGSSTPDSIQINFDAAVGNVGTMTIKANETLEDFPRAFSVLHFKAISGTQAFRAWGV